MPKEFAHLSLASEMVKALPPDSIFYHAVHRHYPVFLYGSVIPDSPYFYITGPQSEFIQRLTRPFHTNDNSCLFPLLLFLKAHPETDLDAVAFAAGICCHLMADTVFHPLVYYFSGFDGIHNGATTRHRIFETAMDYYFWPEKKNQFSLLHIYDHINIPQNRFISFVEALFQIQDRRRKKYLPYAVRSHQLFQSLFTTHQVYKLIHFLHRHKFVIRSRDEALCYPYKTKVAISFFNNTLRYKDPCRGTVTSTSMNDLVKKTNYYTINLLNIIEETYTSGSDLLKVIRHPDLPEICPDVFPGQKQSFWHGEKDLKQLIYRKLSLKGGSQP